MKFVSTKDTESWELDSYGNKVDKKTGEFVILTDKYTEPYIQPSEGFVRVEGEWLPKQIAFDFE